MMSSSSRTLVYWAAVMALLVAPACRGDSFDMVDSCRIFCKGPLLDAVQNAHLFHDSKHFVDMPLVHDPDTTLTAFNQLENKNDASALRAFVQQYFSEPGTELDECVQSDWVPQPSTFDRIEDPVYRNWAYEIHSKWKTLCRKIKDDVKRNANRYSLITVPHPFIAPGGRFREFYYWDTYWIVKGLLASGMYNSTKLAILNLADMVEKYGFVPNGGRIYYLRRSQPPLLSGCIYEYFKATNDTLFVQQMLPLLERERDFWKRTRSVQWTSPHDGERLRFYQYRVDADGPRPESYKEDLDTAAHETSIEGKRRIWSDIAAACESGWDFSSRWFTRNESSPFRNNLRSVRTSRVVPIDLNSFVCWNDGIMAELYTLIGNHTQSAYHQSEHEYMRYAIHKAFWNPVHGTWFDLDLDTKAQREDYFVSNPTPLFAGCSHNAKDVHRRVMNYLKASGGEFDGGLSTSTVLSGEQWDNPNGWAPVNHIVVEALRTSTDPQVQEAAFQLANRWLQTNYFVFVRSGGKMFEKYDVEKFKSKAGGGGEYEVQEGFGWTNGVVLDLLLRYGDRLRAPPVPPVQPLPL